MANGIFDVTVNPLGWFDKTAQAEGWFDSSLLEPVSSGPSAQSLSPSLFSNTNTFYAATVSPGPVTLSPSLYQNSNGFFAANITQGGATQNLTPSLVNNSNTIYSAVLTSVRTLTPTLYSNTSTFFAPQVTSSKTLTPSLYGNTQVFYTPTVSTAYALSPVRFDNTNQFYTLNVTSGSANLTQNSRLDNVNQFYTVTLSRGDVVLQPQRLDSLTVFYGGQVSTGAVTLQPSRYDNPNALYGVTVNASNVLAFEDYVASGYWQTGYVSGGLVEVNEFFAADVTPGPVSISPPYFENTNTLYAPRVINLSGATISSDSLSYLADIWTRLGLNPNEPIVITPTSLTSTSINQTYTGTVDVTCSRQFVQHADHVDPNLMILDLYQRLGLDSDAPMITKAKEITFGGSSIQLSGDTTITMQRI